MLGFWIEFAIFVLIFTFVGNALTTLVYRIPNGIPCSGLAKKPTCGGCNIRLTQADIFPFYRYIFVSKFCKCGKYSIPWQYFGLEIASAICAGFIYILWCESPIFLGKTIFCQVLLMMICIYSINRRIYDNALWIMAFCGLFFLMYEKSFDIFSHIGILISGFIFLQIVNKKLHQMPNQDFRFALILLACCNFYQLICLVIIFLLLFIFNKFYNMALYVINIIATIIFIILEVFVCKFII